jgi:hypothetical protein
MVITFIFHEYSFFHQEDPFRSNLFLLLPVSQKVGYCVSQLGILEIKQNDMERSEILLP